MKELYRYARYLRWDKKKLDYVPLPNGGVGFKLKQDGNNIFFKYVIIPYQEKFTKKSVQALLQSDTLSYNLLLAFSEGDDKIAINSLDELIAQVRRLAQTTNDYKQLDETLGKIVESNQREAERVEAWETHVKQLSEYFRN